MDCKHHHDVLETFGFGLNDDRDSRQTEFDRAAPSALAIEKAIAVAFFENGERDQDALIGNALLKRV
jgi:hypothetical protein